MHYATMIHNEVRIQDKLLAFFCSNRCLESNVLKTFGKGDDDCYTVIFTTFSIQQCVLLVVRCWCCCVVVLLVVCVCKLAS